MGVSKQVINTGEGWVYLDKLSTQGGVGGGRAMCPLPSAHMSLIRKDSGEH
jgi:hypothetical protein